MPVATEHKFNGVDAMEQRPKLLFLKIRGEIGLFGRPLLGLIGQKRDFEWDKNVTSRVGLSHLLWLYCAKRS